MAEVSARILAVDDEPRILDLCREVLGDAGYEVATASGAGEALQALEQHAYDLVLTDLRMPGASGMDLMEAARRRDPELPFVVLTGFPSIEAAMDAVRGGAADFLPKPFNIEHLTHVVHRTLEQSRLREENRSLRRRLDTEQGPFRLLGNSRRMRELLETLHRAAPTDSSVLVLGESGSGKERVARALHAGSRREAGPFVPLDCAALPESLLESELFGYEKGAFTGAVARRQGLIESAQGGTLFLDEIGELSVALQAKLLRVLEERHFRRVGSQDLLEVDVRIVAATHVDLPLAIRAGRFREDLFFRLNVIPVQVPSLRERRSDIPILARAFLEEFSSRRDAPPRSFAPEVLERLQGYAWPGNVRELRNVVERMTSMAGGGEIVLQDIPLEILGASQPPAPATRRDLPFREAKDRTVRRFEKAYLEDALQLAQGNVTRAARDAGMNRSAFQRLMRRHGLQSTSYRASPPPS